MTPATPSLPFAPTPAGNCTCVALPTLARQGWSRETLKPGDQVTIEGFRAKNGSTTCNSRTVKTADGKTLFAGSSLGQGNEQ